MWIWVTSNFFFWYHFLQTWVINAVVLVGMRQVWESRNGFFSALITVLIFIIVEEVHKSKDQNGNLKTALELQQKHLQDIDLKLNDSVKMLKESVANVIKKSKSWYMSGQRNQSCNNDRTVKVAMLWCWMSGMFAIFLRIINHICISFIFMRYLCIFRIILSCQVL